MEFNNVRIKEGDEWKGAFTTHIGSFEPTVMFFGMTNSPATFQAMMNEILRDLINEGKVAAFMDNVLVGTETEEGHDEIVEEILRRLEENDLYVKPEKCVWKVKKIGFLGVVIGPNGIEMEEGKVEGCKGDRSKAPGDSSVNYNLRNIVTTYLQEIPQRIR